MIKKLLLKIKEGVTKIRKLRLANYVFESQESYDECFFNIIRTIGFNMELSGFSFASSPEEDCNVHILSRHLKFSSWHTLYL